MRKPANNPMKKTPYMLYAAVATMAAAMALSSCKDSPKEAAQKSLIELGIISSAGDLEGEKGKRALYDAASQKKSTLAKTLITAGVDVNKESAEGKTPLVQAAYAGNVETVKALIAAGANVNHVTSNGMNILMHAAFGGDHVEVVRVLLAAGADSSFRSCWGYNVMDYARRHRRTKVIRLLQKSGAK